MTSQSREGRRDFPDFEVLDARNVCVEKDHLQYLFKRGVSVEQQQAKIAA